MKVKKIFGLLATSLMALPLLIGGALGAGEIAEAATSETVNVTLNKRLFDTNYPESTIQNTGEAMPDFGGEPLAGVTFTAYDITAYYHGQINDSSQSAVTNAIVADTADAIAAAAGTPLNVPTGDNGQASFANLPAKSTYQVSENSVTKDAVYLFVETGTPNTTTITKKAAPIVLALPIYGIEKNSDGSIKLDDNGNVIYTDVVNENIHLYPKNQTATDSKVADYGTQKIYDENDPTKLLYYNATTADEFSYTLTINIPENISSLTSFTITDEPSAGLELVGTPEVGTPKEGTSEVELLGDGDYTLTQGNGNFVISLTTSSTTVGSLAGKTLIITYQMKFKDSFDIDKLQTNKAYVSINGSQQSDLTTDKVGTGGHQFTKIDGHTGQGLAGAKFKVQKSDTEYAKFNLNGDGEYAFKGWVAESEATEISSGTDGVLKVIGLANGDYNLIETAAPSDKYVKLEEAVSFTVTHGEYETADLITKVSNTPKGLLPSTGGNGILAFLAIGLALMTGAFIWYKKAKRPSEV
ncbi:SpaH/EbpB family LPXTG-anchored major pilin [Enterococcus dongliensis]|uniref:SpaH/EbpB family LPXTG-anchored major pilin n=1 Tax=Enterococcus dongliensis TaxID=2559925 RepID=UPI00288E74CA|nr:SpaH/EbpB family LPXTG-anchored major pilin [Enterococcus dongliensis]MDT2612922.1 SpaH/EbpB family LPXTG-anchored major pilin [Enterococcus dongliensis]